MLNPILSQLNSPLMSNLITAKQMLQGKNPNAVLNNMLQNNPQFKQFYEIDKDKTVEQIANEYGIDYNQIKALLE